MVRRPEDAGVLERRCHANGVELPMVVVGGAVPSMNGHIDAIAAGDQAETLEVKADLGVADEFALARLPRWQ